MIQRCAHNAQVFATGDRDDDALTLALEVVPDFCTGR
jgi:hypothetical protein